MARQTLMYTPNTKQDFEVDPKLKEQYDNRDKYCFIKRKIIEAKYNKAFTESIRDKYYNATIKK